MMRKGQRVQDDIEKIVEIICTNAAMYRMRTGKVYHGNHSFDEEFKVGEVVITDDGLPVVFSIWFYGLETGLLKTPFVAISSDYHWGRKRVNPYANRLCMRRVIKENISHILDHMRYYKYVRENAAKKFAEGMGIQLLKDSAKATK